MDIVTAAQFDKDISATLPTLDVKCGFEAEFASVLHQRYVAAALAYFLEHPDATEIDDAVTSTRHNFNVSTNYVASGKGKSYTTWSIESDPTVPTDHIHSVKVELVSPVLTLPDMLKGMKAVFAMMRAKYTGTQRIGGMAATYYGDFFSLAMTSKETGLHLTFSIKGTKARAVDVLKLAVLMGESHWATYLGREQHSYAVAALHKFDLQVLAAHRKDFNTLGLSLNAFSVAFVDAYFAARGYRAAPPNTPVSLLEQAGSLYRSLQTADAKYSSVHTGKADNGLLEFRLPGGKGYENKYDKIAVMAERFAYAFFAASDDSAYLEYYKNKLLRRTLNILGKHTDYLKKVSVFNISDLLPKIVVAQGHTLLALTHPRSSKVYAAWNLIEVGANAYKIDDSKSLESLTISQVDRASGRTNAVFEYLGTKPNDFTLCSRDSKQLIYDSEDLPMYPGKYVTPKVVQDIRGSSVTVVSTGSKDSMFFEDRAAVLAMDDTAINKLDPGVAAVIRDTQSKVGPSHADELAILIEGATTDNIVALQSRYKSMILDATQRSPSRSATFLVDPLTPGVIDLAYSASPRFTPEMAAEALSAPRFIDYASASGIIASAATDSVRRSLNRFPLLFVHYRLIAYMITASGNSASSYIIPPLTDLSAEQQDFFIQTIAHLPPSTHAPMVDNLIDLLGHYTYQSEDPVVTDFILAVTSSLPDLSEPLTGLEDQLPDSQTAKLLQALAGEAHSAFGDLTKLTPGGQRQRFLDTVKDRWPNMYASFDFVIAKRQVSSAMRGTTSSSSVALALAFRNSDSQNDIALSYLAREAVARTAETAPNTSDIPSLTKLLYRAVFAGLFDITALPDWAKGDKATIVASHELLHSRKLSEDTPDAVLSLLTGLKGQLYRDFLSSATGFGPLTAGKVAGFGAVSHGMDALGEGAASFYAAIQKRSNTWNINSVSAFVSGLYSMMPAALHVIPPAPSVLFDLIAQDVSKLSLERPSDPEVADLQRRFASYVRATKGKAKIKVAPLTVGYLTIPAPTFTEIQGSFPADWPEQAIFTPRQLASIFGSDTGETVDITRIDQIKKADLVMRHLSAYSVDQLVELFSFPAPNHASVGNFGTSAIRSLGFSTNSGQTIMEQVNTNILLAADRFGGDLTTDMLVMYWKYCSNFPEKSSSFFAPDDTSNEFDISDYFIRLAAGSSTRVVTGDYDIPLNSIESFVGPLAIRVTSFASKDFVSFYKFLVKNRFIGHNIPKNLTYLLKAYHTDYKSPNYRVALIDALYAEADKKDGLYGLPTSINATYGYPDMER